MNQAQNGGVIMPAIPAIRNIGVIGSRRLPYALASKVGDVTDYLLSRDYQVVTGGAMGTDHFCLERILERDLAERCTIFSAWQVMAGFPAKIRASIRLAHSKGACIMWGLALGNEASFIIKNALLYRNRKLVEACEGLVAFLMPDSKGTLFTVNYAVKNRLKLVVFPINCVLPSYPNVKWVALKCGGYWDGSYKAVYLK